MPISGLRTPLVFFFDRLRQQCMTEQVMATYAKKLTRHGIKRYQDSTLTIHDKINKAAPVVPTIITTVDRGI